MFIKVRQNNCPVLLPLSKIALVEPFDGGKKVSIKSTDGSLFFWDGNLDAFQDVLIDNGAQVTAPFATTIKSFESCVASLARSMEEWRELASTPIINCDGMTPEEEARFRRTMDETRATLDSIQPRLVVHQDETKARLNRAEALLAEVHHAWNNDADAASAIGHYLGSNIENFLYPGEKKTCDKE